MAKKRVYERLETIPSPIPEWTPGIYRLTRRVEPSFDVDHRQRDIWPNAAALEGYVFHVEQFHDAADSWPELRLLDSAMDFARYGQRATPASRWFWDLWPHLEKMPETCWAHFKHFGPKYLDEQGVLSQLLLDGAVTHEQVTHIADKMRADLHADEDAFYQQHRRRMLSAVPPRGAL